MSSVPSSQSVKSFGSLKIPNPEAVEDVTKNVPELIYDLKYYNFFKSGSNKHKYFVLPKEFDELGYSENGVDHGRSLWPELLSIQRLL
ncbi:unnamed protein product [Hymenolepis diminuta]|uniref:Uncharacterized protein n=1 Tax=Hymenolepis diminuta TaxID=6216 RepID=A0A564Y662_HYMDI|nr:unnamed protein product [Hymenolepis diminuta]